MGKVIYNGAWVMEFIEAKEYVDSFSRYGSVLGLENMINLLEKLGNPQEKLKVIHVAGTNGKGSTIAFLSQILLEAGYRVGKYISPVVFDYMEKYQIDNINISEEDFALAATKVRQAAEEMASEGKGLPTIFEIETAMAFEYLSYKGCDIAIIETGMGGDTDATNVCSRVLASIIVSISLDHMQFLGDTLEEVAAHKAGIIKEGCPVVIYEQSEQVINIVVNRGKKLNAPVYIAKTHGMEKEPFDYISNDGTTYEGVTTGLKGTWQVKNACVAIEAIEVLKKQGYSIPKAAVINGLKNTVWPGRFETISREPHIVIDGAHNPGAAGELRKTLDIYYNDAKIIYIMGVLADKDFTEVISIMAGRAEKIITVTPNNVRALHGAKLAEAVKEVNSNVVFAQSVEEAVEEAIKEYNKLQGEKLILAFGSLSYLNKLKETEGIKKDGYR